MNLITARATIVQAAALKGQTGAAPLADAKAKATEASQQAAAAATSSNLVQGPHSIATWEKARATNQAKKGVPAAPVPNVAAINALKTPPHALGPAMGAVNGLNSPVATMSGKVDAVGDRALEAAAESRHLGPAVTAQADATELAANTAKARAQDLRDRQAEALVLRADMQAKRLLATQGAPPAGAQAAFEQSVDALAAKLNDVQAAANAAKAAGDAAFAEARTLANQVYDSNANSIEAAKAIKAGDAASEAAAEALQKCQQLSQQLTAANTLNTQLQEARQALDDEQAAATQAVADAQAALQGTADAARQAVDTARNAAADLRGALDRARQAEQRAAADLDAAQNLATRAAHTISTALSIVSNTGVGQTVCGWVGVAPPAAPPPLPDPGPLTLALNAARADLAAAQRAVTDNAADIARLQARLDALPRAIDPALTSRLAAARQERLALNPVLQDAQDAVNAMTAASAECSTAVTAANLDAGNAQAAAQSAITKRMDHLNKEGHGPARHEGQVTTAQLERRALYKINPQTNTQLDFPEPPATVGSPHAAASTASKFNSEKAYVLAEAASRALIPVGGPTGSIRPPLDSIFGAGKGAANASGVTDMRPKTAIPMVATKLGVVRQAPLNGTAPAGYVAAGTEDVPLHNLVSNGRPEPPTPTQFDTAQMDIDAAAMRAAGPPPTLKDADFTTGRAHAEFLDDGLGNYKLHTMWSDPS